MKELSIEERAQRYDEALERAKKWYNAPNIDKMPTYGNRIIEEIFPELKEENEDEKIRKELIKFVKVNIPNEERYIAWLEKQGNPTEINPSEFDLRLNKLLKQFETLPKEELASSLSFYLNVVQNDGTYREEKQGEQKHANKVEPKDYNGIDPYFGKPVDKVEPKFKVGDWVVSPNGVYWHIDKISNNRYEVTSNTGENSNWSLDTNIYHRFTIQDAKDGDVLADNIGVILFKSISDNNVINYYAYLSGLFAVQKGEEYWGYAVNCALSPATKEQRKIFFAAMHDAGYEWDAEKKELKKIEQEPIDCNEEYYNEELKNALFTSLRDAREQYLREKNAAWSEEDENILEAITYTVKNSGYSHCIGVSIKVMIDWLKSIKDRVQAQPKQEENKRNLGGISSNWSEEDEKIALSIAQIFNCASLLNIVPDKIEKVKSWLKSLRPQKQWKPSEKQMDALKEACDEHWEPDGLAPLYTLYQELKKLREE